MTGSGDAGIVSSGGDITGELGSLLGDAYDSASSAEPSEAAPGPEAGESLIQDDPGEIPAQQDTANPATGDQQPAAAAQPGADASPYKLSPDGNAYMVPKGEFPRLQQAQKYHEQVSRHFATPQEAQSAAMQAADLRIMSNDFISGSDEGIRQVLAHWAGMDHAGNPAAQQRYQQSFAKMASQMPDVLKGINPQAHEALAGKFISDRIESAYQKAAASGNPEDFKTAQEMDYGFTGQYKTDVSQIQKAPTSQTTAAEQRMRDFEVREANALKRDIGEFNSAAVEGAKFKQFGDVLDRTLAKVKDRYSEVAYNDLKAGIHRELIDTMKAAPDSWWLEHTQEWQGLMDAYRQVWKSGGDVKALQPRVQSYIQSFASRANRLLPAIAQKRIGAATSAARARNGQFAAEKPQTEGQPARTQQPQTNGQMKRLSRDEWDSELAAALRV